MNQTTRLILVGGLACSALLLGACGGDSDKQRRFQVSITNLTNNQPLSPLLLAIHNADVEAWQIGQPASEGLEHLAEGGDGALLSQALTDADATVTLGDAPLAPGATETFTVRGNNRDGLRLTVATMLVNTNDAFTGIDSTDLSELERGQSLTLYSHAYDSGTEANTEAADTIPGPAGGGEGYNPQREARDFVSLHSGVVTQADGLAASALDESHRFDNPVVQLVITRR